MENSATSSFRGGASTIDNGECLKLRLGHRLGEKGPKLDGMDRDLRLKIRLLLLSLFEACVRIALAVWVLHDLN